MALYLLVHDSIENDRKDVSNHNLKLCADLLFFFGFFFFGERESSDYPFLPSFFFGQIFSGVTYSPSKIWSVGFEWICGFGFG